ncbi:hypothetical protein EMCRGX_G029454 [Ephydatia muelleri]
MLSEEHEMGRCTCMAVGRLRLTVFILSFVGFATLVMLQLRPEPSNLLPNRPPKSRRVSVILFPTSNTEAELQVLDNVVAAIKRYNVEPEFLCIVGSPFGELLTKRGFHVELVDTIGGFSSTVIEAFNKAHFSLLLVLGELSEAVSELVPKLVDPVVGGQSDLTVSLSTEMRAPFLVSTLAFPLTHARAAVGNSSTFCFHRAVWIKGCKSVAHDAPSITLELLAKCSVHFPIVVKNERIGGHISSIRIFVQVLTLYWQLHPIIASLASTCALGTLAFVLFVLCLRTLARLRSRANVHSRVV